MYLDGVGNTDVFACKTCGYVFGKIVVHGENVERFVRGPRAGEIKNISKDTLHIRIGDDEKPETLLIGAQETTVYNNGKELVEMVDKVLYVCPRCRAVYEEFPTVRVR